MFRFSCVLLALLLTYQLIAQAKVAPGPSIIARGEDSSSSRRTLFNIAWGCFSTTIICAWAAVHPNIPPCEGPFKRTLRRLELMFWTIVAPEILPCWALNQLLAAITVRDVYNEGKGYEKRRRIWERVKEFFSLYEIKEAASPAWTVAHGHFLIMGGFHVVELPDGSSPMSAPSAKEINTDMEKGDGPSEKTAEAEREQDGRVTILTLEMLRELVKDPEFKIQMTEREVTHRSKGDALSKFIFIMQSTWFILQCLGRCAQGLNLTQLELTTLALASLNGITFALWWDKPLGAQALVRMYLGRKLTDSERVSSRHDKDRSTRSGLIPWIQEVLETCVTTIREAFLCQSKENILFVWLVHLPVAILLLFLLPILAFTFAFHTTLRDLAEGTSSSFPPDDTHVPTFYVPKHRYSERYHVLLLVTLGAIFGGIHCSGWNFPFPTYTEQKIWRIASLAVTIFPIAAFPFGHIISSIARRLSPTIEPFVAMAGGLILLLCALAYVSARLVLLGLALSILRRLPPTAFTAVDWTTFYPHIL